MAVACLAPASNAWQSLRTIDVIRNGDFEESSISTADYGATIHGSFWHHAEGKTAIVPFDTTRALELATEKDFAYQKFAAYQYFDSVNDAVEEGATENMVISGRIAFTGSSDFEARVILEETRKDISGSYWAFYQEFEPDLGGAGSAISDQDGNLDDDWVYRSRATSDGSWRNMPAGSKSHNLFDAEIREFQQVASTLTSTARAYEVTQTGKLLVQTRVSNRPWSYQAVENPTPLESIPKFRIQLFSGDPLLGGVQVGSNYCDVEVGRDAQGDDQDFLFGEYIDVVDGQFLVFETYESFQGPYSAGFQSEPICIMPRVSYDARQMIYRFGGNLSASPLPDQTYNYVGNTNTPTAGQWVDFSFNVGSAYTTWLGNQHPTEIMHGPVPQLAVKLEVVDVSNGTTVYFDDIVVDTDFLYPTKQEMYDDTIAELDRLITNYIEYEVKEPGTSGQPLPLFPEYVMDAIWGHGVAGNKYGTRTKSGFSALGRLILDASHTHWFPEATPWLLDHADQLVSTRDKDVGAWKNHDLSGTSATPDSFVTGDKISHTGMETACDMYDLTGDIRYLDSAYEMATAFRTAHDLNHPVPDPRYHKGKFTYDASGRRPSGRGHQGLRVDIVCRWIRTDGGEVQGVDHRELLLD